MLKCKYMEITDVAKRQLVMHNESEKELVLYSEAFNDELTANHEFVVGLPYELTTIANFNYEQLANDYRYHAQELLQANNLSIAIHQKKQDEELHFHINFTNEKASNEDATELVRSVFDKLNNELLSRVLS